MNPFGGRCCSLALLLALSVVRSSTVYAAGFAVAEQSARGLGSAFAGEAATAEDATTEASRQITRKIGRSYSPRRTREALGDDMGQL